MRSLATPRGKADELGVPADENIYITKVVAGSATALDGRVKLGDRIESVSGVSFSGMSHDDALDVLRAITTQVEIEISRPGNATGSRSREGGYENVDLRRPSSPPASDDTRLGALETENQALVDRLDELQVLDGVFGCLQCPRIKPLFWILRAA